MKKIFTLLIFIFCFGFLQAQTNYFFITKKELVNNDVVSNSVGYVLLESDAIYINENNHGKEFIEWLEVNKTDLRNNTKQLNDFFTENNIIVFYQYNTSSTSLSGRSNNEITDFINLP